MNQSEASELITQLFLRLRGRGFKLGLEELQLALQAIAADFCQNEQSLLEMAEIIWSHTRLHQSQIRLTWKDLLKAQATQKRQSNQEVETSQFESEQREGEQNLEINPKTPVPESRELNVPSHSEISALPIQAPFEPIERKDLLDLQSYFPVSRRSMVYGWRALQRWVAEGAKTVLDVPTTIQLVTEQGFYLEPVYQRRRRNCARLLMLIDQNGSMMPFHRFTRDLAETACDESLFLPEQVQVFYFHNVPSDSVYRDLYLTEPIPLNDVLAGCDSDTSVVIIGDAGAARGFRKQERIRQTTRFLRRLRQRTPLIAWLNPLPKVRWEGSSAEILAYLVPMFAMDRFGFGDAIAALRGVGSAGVVEL